MMDLLFPFIAGLAAFSLVGYLVYDRIYQKKKRQQHGKEIRILLYELVGAEKVFKGTFTGYEQEDDKIGLYIMIQGLKKPIEVVNNNDFFPDSQFGKCLMVCKYADDDYRAMARMRDGEWWRYENLPPEEYFETVEQENPETGNTEVFIKKDDNGDPIPKKDEDGDPIPSYHPVPYTEPIGVKQSAREAMRFNRDFKMRMQEKRKEHQGFWAKYGQTIMVLAAMMIVFLSMAYMTNRYTDAMDNMVDTFGEKAEEVVEATKDPHWAEQLVDEIGKKEKEDNAPPD